MSISWVPGLSSGLLKTSRGIVVVEDHLIIGYHLEGRTSFIPPEIPEFQSYRDTNRSGDTVYGSRTRQLADGHQKRFLSDQVAMQTLSRVKELIQNSDSVKIAIDKIEEAEQDLQKDAEKSKKVADKALKKDNKCIIC